MSYYKNAIYFQNNVDFSKNKTVAKEEEDAEESLDVLKQIIMQLIEESKYKNKGIVLYIYAQQQLRF